ncbi:LysM peptidoglycan-binding domain-containing protein [Streptococcus sobrinus]|uniref:LysM peptidoglycan-binding domain-containing protein n=3 Tax=Streptococcus sobrinus TaxID=1310 RepID=UPI0002F98726|nr:LysM peptidoglycan-binding domain-containing protein [Streptococcus sobrinus]AWN18006.1 LysM peptidoglycan-binding domain-containing protein [Streptococcus sobrinus]
MKLNKKMLLASTLALSVFAATNVQAEEASTNQNWAPRSVEEVKADLANQGDTTTYTVKSGDTLSTIAEAMGIDVNVLAKVNSIADVNVIFPGTVISATYDANHNATDVTIQGAGQETPQASVDLSNNQVTVGENTTSLDDIETPASSEAPATDNSQAMPAPEAPASEGAQTSEVSDQAAATSEVADQGQAQSATADQAAPVADQGQGAQADNQANDQSASSEMPAASSEDNQSETPAPASESQAQDQATPAQADQAPVAQEAEHPTATEQAAPQNSNVNTDGLQPSAANFANDVANKYGTTDIYGVRQGDSGDHGSGNAVDVMTYDNTQLGQEVADYATSNMEANNISYVIYQQKFYAPTDNKYGPAYTWNEMPDRGDATANHMDHVHVSFNN